MIAAYDALADVKVADRQQVAIMGFCFGGMVALDLARSAVELSAAISIHGVLAPNGLTPQPIQAKLLALHGYLDPQISSKDLQAFMQEMHAAGADWQLHYFGDAQHAFTDPEAAAIGPDEAGRVYHALATERSWRLCFDLFSEVFA